MGRFLADTFNYRKAYGKAGPLREAPYKRKNGPYGKGQSLTGRAGVPYGSFTEKDDEEAYGKAGPLREAPYREDRSLREGAALTGRAGGLLRVPLRERRSYATGALTGRPPYGKPYGEERSLREGRVLTGRAGVLYGAKSLHRE